MATMRRMLLLAVLCAIVTPSWAGDLAKMRGDLHSDSGSKSSSESKSSSSKSSSRSNDSYGSSFDNDDDSDSLTSQLAGAGLLMGLAGIASPFWLPHEMLGDNYYRNGYFPRHPYEHFDGALTHDHDIEGTHDTAVLLQGVIGSDLSDMLVLNGRALVEHRTRFGIDTEFNYRRENLATSHDSLYHGDFNVTYRFAQSEHWLLRAGLGVNWLTTQGDAEAGFNFTYGVDWFPVEPVVVSGVIDWGRVGGAGLFHGRTTVGFTQKGWGAFTGYDYFRISDSGSHTWINGIELRF